MLFWVIIYRGFPASGVPKLYIIDIRVSFTGQSWIRDPPHAYMFLIILSPDRSFYSNALSYTVILVTGAHTLGVGHCRNIVDRLYNPHPGSQIINHSFELLLRLACPTKTPLTSLTVVPNDMTPFIFDNRYYRDVTAGNGLFGIDSSISRDLRTASVVNQFALDQDHFFQVFSSAFVRLSTSNVIGEAEGEVRRICNRVNG